MFKKEQEYFTYFSTNMYRYFILNEERLIAREILIICNEMKRRIENISKENFFEELSYILGLDARLQIILELAEILPDSNLFSEEEIISISKKDYPSYLKELVGISYKDSSPHSLFFSIC